MPIESFHGTGDRSFIDQRAAGFTPAASTTGINPAARRGGLADDTTASGAAARDHGRLLIEIAFVPLLRSLGLDTFDALWNFSAGTVVRTVGSRETRRITLPTPAGPRDFYLKRFGAPRWRDRIRALMHLNRPIHGARPEWEAIGHFIAAGIATVVPVACGESGDRSLLLTEALASRCNLLDLVGGRQSNPLALRDEGLTRSVRTTLPEVADLARRMHAAGLHHQDFYLNHLLLCGEELSPQVHVIDLGRAQRRRSLTRRWVVKDLAQLNFSAQRVPWPSRLRFLRLYLDRPFRRADRRLVRRIAFKSQRIAAHTAKHDL